MPADTRAWLRDDLNTSDWLFTIDEQTSDEIHATASLVQSDGFNNHHPADENCHSLQMIFQSRIVGSYTNRLNQTK